MVRVNGISNLDYSKIAIDEKWNDCDDMELTMHTIHAYPAKFPAFMASKALNFAGYACKQKIVIISFGDAI